MSELQMQRLDAQDSRDALAFRQMDDLLAKLDEAATEITISLDGEKTVEHRVLAVQGAKAGHG
jgi:hypothetical protein